MYRVSPVTYFVDSMVSTGVAGVNVVCDSKEIIQFKPPIGQTCGSYLEEYITSMGGNLLNPGAVDQCQLCPVRVTDDAIRSLGIYFTHRWRSFGISLVYSAANIAGALLLYWLFRVPKGPRRRKG